MKRLLGMLLTVAFIFATIATVAQLESVGEGGPPGVPPNTGPVSPSPAPTIPLSEVRAVAETAARYLERGELTLALAPLDTRSIVGRCDWDLNTAFTIPNDINRAYVRHRVRREAAIAGVMVAFGQHRDTRVFVTVRCP